MKKTLFLFSTKMVVGLFMVVPFAVFAQINNASTTPLRQREAALQENREDREELRQASVERIRSVQNTIQSERELLKSEIKGMDREEAKKRLEEFRKESQDKREEVHNEIKNERDEFHKKAEDRREELKKKIGEDRARQVEEYFNQMMSRMDAAVDRLDKLADRIESRLNKIHDAGKDTTGPQAALDAARVAIVGVQAAISDARAKFADLTKSATPKEQFAAVKDIIGVVKTKSKEAHAALVEVINSIKKGRLDTETSTTTPSTQ